MPSFRPTAARGLSVGLAALLALASGCSLINQPEDVMVGTGGSGTGGGGAGGGGGAPPECSSDDDCAELTTECGTGACPDGTCVVEPIAAGTACGPALASSCDLQDTCDGRGACTANNLQDGTFCDDCPAGPGMCALCSAGACDDCSGRATQKSFRSPLSASGWQLTGGWALYSETPPAMNFGPAVGECSDGIDNDGDTLIDFPDEPGCSSADDYYESPPFGVPQCSDGADNDGFNNAGDGLVDLLDPDCDSPEDDTEDYLGTIVFDHPVLGTDGNRQHPYGQLLAQEEEVSSATSPPTLLGTTLEFLSWNLDEGFAFDLKGVQVSTDGQSFVTIAICPQNQMTPYAFCTPRTDREPDDWDLVVLDLPAEFQNVVGYVRFIHDSTDSCCQFERGWYVDALNFAQDCACEAATDCAFLDGECASGTCAATGECQPAAENVGAACASTADAGCSMSACDDNGWCASGFLPFEAADCDSCAAGAGLCDLCSNGACLDCPASQTFGSPFGGVQPDLSLWTFTGDWTVSYCVSPNSVTTTDQSCFQPVGMEDEPATYPVMGNNGSRTGVSPYAGESEIEVGSFTTSPSVIPATLTFNSWHQDRGGNDSFDPADQKTIRVSVDGGASWSTVLSCEMNDDIPFCQPWPAFTNRALDAWDAIEIEMAPALVGELGIFEFSYDTIDAGQGWERGWYLDDLNVGRCDYVRPPWP
ncbi:MAG: hypothetical protein IPM79_38625 [Polyangiaceae bacterium]|jgi:hypothetical protein|nr:hypothetical protein [Polyangiaceae bacterium]